MIFCGNYTFRLAVNFALLNRKQSWLWSLGDTVERKPAYLQSDFGAGMFALHLGDDRKDSSVPRVTPTHARSVSSLASTSVIHILITFSY
jgi:hypothetical protein